MMLLSPHISEKSFEQNEKSVYVFDVPLNSNKESIKNAVQEQFKVTVVDVRTVRQQGKPKRWNRKRQQPLAGKRKDFKKAYVQLKAGEKITVLDEGK